MAFFSLNFSKEFFSTFCSIHTREINTYCEEISPWNISNEYFIYRSGYSHAAPFRMYYVGFRAFKSPLLIWSAIGWFPCFQVSYVLHRRARIELTFNFIYRVSRLTEIFMRECLLWSFWQNLENAVGERHSHCEAFKCLFVFQFHEEYSPKWGFPANVLGFAQQSITVRHRLDYWGNPPPI